jgi:DNA-binding transcriptional ArsR family regulator
MAATRRERFRSLHSRDWDRIEDAVPSRPVVKTAAKKAAGLGDPNRLALAILIGEAGAICVTDLADLTGIERSVVSRHLVKLKAAGLSESQKNGKQARHSLTDDGKQLLAALLGK